MNLYDEFFDVVKALRKVKARFAVVGGLAMAFYDEPRFTRDIDLLLHSEDEDVSGAMNKIGYYESAKPWTFKKTPIILHRFTKIEGDDFISVDILVGKEKRIDEIIARATEHPWTGGRVRVVSKDDLIWLKKQRGSDQDKVDIRKLKNDKD